MGRKIVAIAVMLIAASVAAQTTIPGGNVSGTWLASGSPYLIEGEITIPADFSLTIEPGVEVIFQGYYKFIVNGWLEAIGTESDSITFTASDISEGWHGIRFISTLSNIRLSYCIFTHGKATGSEPDNRGGAVFSQDADLVIENCRFSHNYADEFGGALCFYQTSLILTDNLITENHTLRNGSGLYTYECDDFRISGNVVHHNTGAGATIPHSGAAVYINYSGGGFENNSVQYNIADGTTGAGGMTIAYSSPSVQGNNFSHNTNINSPYADDGIGLYCHHSSNPLSINNIISHNNRGAFFCGDDSSPELNNNTIANNGEEAIGLYSNSHPHGKDNIIYGNGGVFDIWGGCSITLTYSCIQGGYSGTGNINQDPLFVDPDNGDYHLQSINGSYHGGAWTPDPNHSPCIDAGDPSSPYTFEPTPNGGRVNMGAYGNTEEASLTYEPVNPNMIVELTYISGSPIGVGGGNLFFEVFAENQDFVSLDLDAWIDISYEGGTPFTAVFRSFTNYLPGWTINRPDMWYPIDPGYPAGNYTMTGKVGVFPNTVWHSSGFPFVKEGDLVDLEFIPFKPKTEFPDPFSDIDKGVPQVEIPEEFGLVGAYPNPFNSSTVLSFALPKPSRVHVTVYDVSGREVARLLDGWHPAGTYVVTFDATGLASGIYFVHLEAGDFTTQQKLVYLK